MWVTGRNLHDVWLRQYNHSRERKGVLVTPPPSTTTPVNIYQFNYLKNCWELLIWFFVGNPHLAQAWGRGGWGGIRDVTGQQLSQHLWIAKRAEAEGCPPAVGGGQSWGFSTADIRDSKNYAHRLNLFRNCSQLSALCRNYQHVFTLAKIPEGHDSWSKTRSKTSFDIFNI